MLRMITGIAAILVKRMSAPPGRESEGDRRAAEALADMRDANMAEEAEARKVVLGGCYHDNVVYSLAYDANGTVELCGETFTSLDTGFDGGAAAALRRHRQNYDPSRDVKRFIVALKPVKVFSGRKDDDTIEDYGLSPGPLAGEPVTANVWGGHVATGQFDFVKRAVEMVKLDCDRRGVDISKSTVTVSVKPRDGQEAFARCEKKSNLAECDLDLSSAHDIVASWPKWKRDLANQVLRPTKRPKPSRWWRCKQCGSSASMAPGANLICPSCGMTLISYH